MCVRKQEKTREHAVIIQRVPSEEPRPLILGRLEREFILGPSDRVVLDRPGGNLFYAAASASIWLPRARLISRVGQDFPSDWLPRFQELGFDIQGIKQIEELISHPRFVVYKGGREEKGAKPIPHFAKLGQPLPKALLDYQPTISQLDSRKERTAATLRESDIPESYADSAGAHLCPMDYLSHSIIPSTLRRLGVAVITMDTGRGYMHPKFWNDLTLLVNGLNCFQATESQLRTLFSGKSEDLWEMAERINSLNCRSVVIKRGERGQLVYDGENRKRYHVPAYPTQPKEALGTGSSYAGGFLAGLLLRQDVLEAALHGGVTASLAVEGRGAEYVLESSTRLATARLDSLRDAVRTQ